MLHIDVNGLTMIDRLFADQPVELQDLLQITETAGDSI
jgi:hypothetical protein